MRVSSPVFIGRDEELAALAAALERAAGERSQVVLLAGDSGVGKSRLLDQFRSGGATSSTHWLSGDCISTAEGDLPYAPIIAALRAVVADLGDRETAPELARLVSGSPPTPGADSAEAAGKSQGGEFARGRLFAQFVSLLVNLSAERPVVLAIEDLHWADQSTRDLLSFLIRVMRDEPVLLVCSYRSDELHRRHPLRPFISEHLRSSSVELLELGAFTQTELEAQLEGILGDSPDPELARRLFERSEGNAFFSEELLAASDAGHERVPATIRDALMLRVDALSAPAQEILRAAAAAGRRVAHRLLAAVADVAEPELTTAIREAVARQLLVQDAEHEAYAFRHALLAESILGDLLPGERTRLHLALAEALASDPRLAAEPGNAAAECAFHWRACHRLGEALAASIEAGLQAESRLAFAEARRHFENALELWDRVEDAPGRADMDRAAVLIRAAQNASLTGEPRRAVDLARSAVDELGAKTDPARAALARERLGEFLWLAGESDDAVRALSEAVDLLPREPSVERARVLAADARLLMLHGRPKDSAAMCEEAISITRDAGADDVRGQALSTLGCDLFCLGDRRRAIDHLTEAMRIAEECSPEDLWRAYANLGEALEQDGRLDDAVALGLEGGELVRALGQRSWGAYILGMVASLLVRLGRLDEAEELVASGLDVLIEGIDTAVLKSVSAEIRVLRGDPEHARSDLGDALRAAGATTDWMIRSMLIDRQVLLAVHAGEPDRAAGLVDQAIESIADGEYVFYTARTYALGVRAHADRAERARALGDARTAAEAERSAAALVKRIDALLEPDRWLDSPPPESVARRALAAAELERATGDATADAWDSVARQWGELGYALELAYCRWRQAEATLSGSGAKADAADALREAARLVEDSGASALRTEIEGLARRARIDLGSGHVTAAPEAPDSELDRFGLTDRELDVLALLAEGRTNPEIAETLYISRKTASAHVSHILAKLEVRSRVEAATLAHRLGFVPEKSG